MSDHWLGFDERLPDQLAARLRQPQQDIALTPGMRTAAVLAVIFPDSDGLFIPLIERAAGAGIHGGQLALPGGAQEEGDDSLVKTALREAAEEVALDPAVVRVLGRLPVVSVRVSGFEAVPFVGWTAQRPRLAKNEAEVAAIIDFPLGLLLEPTALVQVPNPPGSLHPTMYEISFGEYRVWGATARMLANLSLALNGIIKDRQSGA